MNYIWRRAGLDLRMTPYEVVMTGSDSGLVKVKEREKRKEREILRRRRDLFREKEKED